MLQALRKIQGDDDSKKSVIAIGGIDYANQSGWLQFYDAIRLAGTFGSGANTVIAISSAKAWYSDKAKCRAIPPATFRFYESRFPCLVRFCVIAFQLRRQIGKSSMKFNL